MDQPTKSGLTHILQVKFSSTLISMSDSCCLALPCDENGNYLPRNTPPPDHQPLDATPDNPFHPFEDRLAFEFADYHFSRQESSESSINEALRLWAAQSAKNGHDDVPWNSATAMYETIDKIRQGNNPWKSVPFHYNGPKPNPTPKWMSEKYVLVTRNIYHLLCEQIACIDFDGHWDYAPFIEFNHDGSRVWTNIMSGDWAAKQAVRVFFYMCVCPSQQSNRTRFLRIRRTTELCSFALSLGAIKRSHRSQLVIKNSIQYILAQEISTIRLDVLTAMGSYHVPFFPFLMV